MSAAKDIRDKYSLSQPQLAALLGISRSMLAMIETGKRCFSIEALQKINTLGMSYEKNAAVKSSIRNTTPPVKQLAAMRREIKKQLSDTRRKALRLQDKLDAIAATYNAGLLQVAGIQKILAGPAKKQKSIYNQGLLNIQLFETNNRINDCNPIQQAMLQIKLQALQLEATLLEQLLQTPASKTFSIKEIIVVRLNKAMPYCT
jgi:transcriptional regulator with XRE-family HTH domain